MSTNVTLLCLSLTAHLNCPQLNLPVPARALQACSRINATLSAMEPTVKQEKK